MCLAFVTSPSLQVSCGPGCMLAIVPANIDKETRLALRPIGSEASPIAIEKAWHQWLAYSRAFTAFVV
ncbi:hypothetical protein PSE10B_02520 [Pseudomonas amygdali pv. eriobotryae]|nr:hypothetical protein PSE10B_02520 [Pseudomonas amygdali pv. eriobotryae]